jgi:HD superfamily phosphodiesterase
MSSFQMRVPDTELCTAAVQYARAVSDPFLFHHVMRSALFGGLIGREPGVKYDRELLWVSAVLHDLGLTKIAPGEARFEIEGADLANEFLTEKGMSERQVEIVWITSVWRTPERAGRQACPSPCPSLRRRRRPPGARCP